MRIWITDRRRFLIFGAAGLVLLLFVALFLLLRNAPSPVAVGREILFPGTWGGGDNQFGRYQGVDGKVYGPQSLAIAAGGQVYVLDTYNRRVLIFDGGGKPQGSINLPKGNVEGYSLPPFPDDIAVDAKGRVYLADNRNVAILVYDPAGKPLGVLKGAPPEEASGAPWYGRVENLYTVADVVYADELWMNKDKAVRVIRRYEVPGGQARLVTQVTLALTAKGAVAEGPATGFTSLAVVGGRFYLDSPGSDGGPERRSVTVTDDDGHRLRSITVKGKESLAGARLLGVTRDGHLLYGLSLTREAGEVAVANEHGQVESILRVTGASFEATHPARLSDKGDLYLLTGTPDGVQLVRLNFKRGLSFGRGSSAKGRP